MYCRKCGVQNDNTNKYCENCGVLLYTATPSTVSKKKHKGRVIAVVSMTVVVLLASIVAGYFAWKNVSEKRYYDSLIADSERYLEVLDYEKAELAYLEAISIDPKKPEPYIKLADLYILQGRKEEAIDILQQAEENISDESSAWTENIQEKKEEVEAYVAYQWVVPAQIEADDILYAAEYQDCYNTSFRQIATPYAIIRKENSYGLIDMTGNMITEMEYSSIIGGYNTYFLVRTIPKWEEEHQMECDLYILNDSHIEPMPYDVEPYIECFYYHMEHGLQSNYGDYMTYDLQEPIPVKQTSDSYRTDNSYDALLWTTALEGNYALHYDGQLQSDFIYNECGSSRNNRLAVCQNGKWGYVNEMGEIIIPLEYDASWSDFSMLFDFENRGHVSYCYSYSEGYVPLCKDGVWEMRDLNGNVVIPANVFEKICPVYEGKCWVKQHGKWGVIQLEGVIEEVIEVETLDYKSIYDQSIVDAQNYHNQNPYLNDMYSFLEYTLCEVTGDDIMELFIHSHYEKHGATLLIYSYNGQTTSRIGEIKVDIPTSYVVNGYDQGFIYEEAYKTSYELNYYAWTEQGFVQHVVYTEDNRDWTNDQIDFLSMEDFYDMRLVNQSLPMVPLDDSSVFESASL